MISWSRKLRALIRLTLTSLLAVTIGTVCFSPNLSNANTAVEARSTKRTQSDVTPEQYDQAILGVIPVTGETYLEQSKETAHILYAGSRDCPQCRFASSELSSYIKVATVPIFYLNTGGTFTSIIDTKYDEVVQRLQPYGLTSIPSFYAISKEGKVIDQMSGAFVTTAILLEMESESIIP